MFCQRECGAEQLDLCVKLDDTDGGWGSWACINALAALQLSGGTGASEAFLFAQRSYDEHQRKLRAAGKTELMD
jgi:hypothetical protein